MNFKSQDRLPERGKLFGVMARVGDVTGTDPTWLRIGAVAMLCFAFKLTLAAYCVAAVALRLRRA